MSLHRTSLAFAIAGAVTTAAAFSYARSNQTTGPGARPPEPAYQEAPSSASDEHAQSSDRAPASVPAAAPANAYPAVAVLEPAKDSKAHGTVQFFLEGDKVKVVAKLEGLAPNSKHGFHIHQFGDCTDPSFKSAGDHFNPTSQPHGAPDSGKHHTGDLGNVTADANGNVNYEITIPSMATEGGAVVGRSVVLHKKADDLKTQPSGDSGDRIACGVVGIAKR